MRRRVPSPRTSMAPETKLRASELELEEKLLRHEHNLKRFLRQHLWL